MRSFPLWMMLIIASLILLDVSGAVSTDKVFHLSSGDNNQLNMKPKQTYSTHRKLFADGGCKFEDIMITQGRVPTSGRPHYTVQINNTCPSQCAPTDIHLHCGQFDFEGINPETFQRLYNDDCLVNGGNPLKTGESVNFTYSNSFMYRFSVKKAKLLC